MCKEKCEMKYEYKFEKIGLKGGFIKREPEQDYHNIITMYAEKSWRLVQIFAPAIHRYGAARYFELIFERPID
jgi:hypothetical protein